jgi:DNA polymerase III delta subunit
MDIFLTGDDPIAIRLHKEKQKADFLEQYPEGKVRSYSFASGDTEEVHRVAAELAPSFFILPELFIAEDINLLARKEQKFLWESLKQKSSEKFFVGIENKNIPKGDALHKDLALLNIPVKVFLKKERIEQTLAEELWQKHQGKKLSPRTVAEVSRRVTNDEELLSRLETILLYSEGNEISEQELDTLVPRPLEAKIFEALDCLASGQKDKALVLFRILLEQDDIFRTLGMCAWQVRQMLVVADYVEQGVTDQARIAKETKMHPFVVQKIQGTLRNFPRRRLIKGLGLLAEIDRGLKKSTYTGVAAVDTFVLKF